MSYTFESFVVSAASEAAWSAAVAAAKEPGRAYNPLFLHGPCGSGKTHLLYAAENAMRGAKVWRVPVEAFVASMIEAIRAETMPAFEEGLASFDALLLDDLRFLAGKERTEQELFLQIERAAKRGVQVVVASDAPPRLHVAGLHVVEIGYPEGAARAEIARRAAAAQSLSLPDDALRRIAEQTGGGAPELRSAILQIAMKRSLRSRSEVR